ncbi:hypothetical protein [Verrucomicrobium sp. BvORR106]|uniref:hypothetical protein n=1 Tax=Verrucomicrobium sp. BvORR106 TaxID=1403819 RepID=UPI000571BA3F|nr:hypothetical protein [Verrucomicrobium sp. BvORR106]
MNDNSVSLAGGQVMRNSPLRRLFLLIAVWIPLPCLFLPFTMMREDYHPWYISYTSPLVILAILFYQPANLVTTSVGMLFGFSPSMTAVNIAAVIQSLILSYFVLRSRRKNVGPLDANQS